MVRTARKLPGEITIISLAPSSNIAAAIKSDPEFPKNIKNLVMMGGTYLAQGNSDYYSSEFNFFKDPDAVHLVFD